MAMPEKEVLAKCVCRKCPTYVKCREKTGYCLARKGKNICIKKNSGCICPGCPVFRQEKLGHVYYCTLGSESELK